MPRMVEPKTWAKRAKHWNISIYVIIFFYAMKSFKILLSLCIENAVVVCGEYNIVVAL